MNEQERRVYKQKWYWKDPERSRARAREWNRKHRKEINERRRKARLGRVAWTPETPEEQFYRWTLRLRRKYGITVDDYDRIFRRQNGACAICGRLPGRWRLRVDHDHVSGKVRGLLCAVCNRDLVRVEQGEWILRAVEYLMRSRQRVGF